MYIQSLSPAEGSRTKEKRIGRGIGSGIGKTSGRGGKGQTARSGGQIRLGFEGGQIPLVRRLPIRGFNNYNFRKNYTVINVNLLNAFNDGDTVDVNTLQEKGLVGDVASYGIKVLGNGELTKKLTVKANKFTKSAEEKITKIGGNVEVI